jgi:hypothetical protein
VGFSRPTLLALLGLAVGGAALCLFWPEGGAAPGTLRLLPAGADVDRLELDFGTPVQLARRERRAGGDDWRLAGPPERSADPGVVDAMIAALDVARPARAVDVGSAAPDPRFGFAPPAGRVAVGLSDARSVVVSFGAALPSEHRVYARTSLRPELVLVVDDSLLRSLRRGPEELRDRRLWTLDPERVAAVEVKEGGSTLRVERAGRRFRVEPPGVAADPERAARLFEAVASPRAVGFPAGDACASAGGVELELSADDGVARTLRFRPGAPADCAGCPAESVAACTGDRVTVAVAGDFLETIRALLPELARTSLFPLFDPFDVQTIAIVGAGERWSLHRADGGWRADDASPPPEDEAVARWLLALSLVAVEPSRAESGSFVADGAVELSSRLGGSMRVERSAAAADGSVAVRRDGETVAFRLPPAEAYLLTAPRAHLGAAAGAACDPLAVQSLEVLAAPSADGSPSPVQALRRADGGRWTLAGSTLPADPAMADLLVGDLCRLPLQPLVPRRALAPSPSWTVVLRDAAEREFLRIDVFASSGGGERWGAGGYGAPERHALPASAVERLRRPLVALDALRMPASPGSTIEVALPSGRAIAFTVGTDGWSAPGLPGPLASRLATTLAAPLLLGAIALDVSDEPSVGWPRRCTVTRLPVAGPASTLVVGGPDAAGRVLAWSSADRALFELGPDVLAELLLLESLTAP